MSRPKTLDIKSYDITKPNISEENAKNPVLDFYDPILEPASEY